MSFEIRSQIQKIESSIWSYPVFNISGKLTRYFSNSPSTARDSSNLSKSSTACNLMSSGGSCVTSYTLIPDGCQQHAKFPHLSVHRLLLVLKLHQHCEYRAKTNCKIENIYTAQIPLPTATWDSQLQHVVASVTTGVSSRTKACNFYFVHVRIVFQNRLLVAVPLEPGCMGAPLIKQNIQRRRGTLPPGWQIHIPDPGGNGICRVGQQLGKH